MQLLFIFVPLFGIIALVAILLFLLLKRRKQALTSLPQQQTTVNEAISHQAAAHGDDDQKEDASKRPKPQPIQRPALPQTVVSEAQKKMEDFSGCFEPLHRASARGSVDSCRLILEEIGNRVRHFNGCDNLKVWMIDLTCDQLLWDEPTARDKAARMMQLFEEAGLEKDNSQTVTVDADTLTRYYHDDIEEMSLGETYHVFSPCWTFNGKVLEKGILK